MNAAQVMESEITSGLESAREAARNLAVTPEKVLNGILLSLADLAEKQTGMILAANAEDLSRMPADDPKYDRLLLNPGRIKQICNDLRKVAGLPSPLGRILEARSLPNGLNLTKKTVPLGVIGIVFESRPNVTFDVFALTLKSGNATVLKGSRDAHFSNLAIHELIRKALSDYGLEGACFLAPSEREALPVILHADRHIDVIIPRGSQGLIDFVRENSSVPVIETGAGVVHIYFDESGDPEKGRGVIENAKARRVSVCNALDTLLIHERRLADLPHLLGRLDTEHQCEVYADPESYAALAGRYSPERLFRADQGDFGREFLSMKMSVKCVKDLQEALDHIARYSSRHSEAVIAEDPQVVADFLNKVDAAVVYANASTAFTDGAQFGLGAEIGISTQKLHARGPMGLQELTSYKWIVTGDGHVRPK